MRHTERNRRLVVIDEHTPIAKRDEAEERRSAKRDESDDRRALAKRDDADDRRAPGKRDDECRALVRIDPDEHRALARRDEPIPADDPSLHPTLDTPVQGDAGSMLAPGSLQGVSSLGRAVMPRDGRRLVALVTRMHGPTRVTLVARRAIVTAGQFRIAIVARGES